MNIKYKTQSTDFFNKEVKGEGYSVEAYSEAAWKKIFNFLIDEGYSKEEAKEILLSKHTRWSRDVSENPNKKQTLSDWKKYYKSNKNKLYKKTLNYEKGGEISEGDKELSELKKHPFLRLRKGDIRRRNINIKIGELEWAKENALYGSDAYNKFNFKKGGEIEALYQSGGEYEQETYNFIEEEKGSYKSKADFIKDLDDTLYSLKDPKFNKKVKGEWEHNKHQIAMFGEAKKILSSNKYEKGGAISDYSYEDLIEEMGYMSDAEIEILGITIAKKLELPIDTLPNTGSAGLEEFLDKRTKDDDEAREVLVSSIKSSRIELGDDKYPIYAKGGKIWKKIKGKEKYWDYYTAKIGGIDIKISPSGDMVYWWITLSDPSGTFASEEVKGLDNAKEQAELMIKEMGIKFGKGGSVDDYPTDSDGNEINTGSYIRFKNGSEDKITSIDWEKEIWKTSNKSGDLMDLEAIDWKEDMWGGKPVWSSKFSHFEKGGEIAVSKKDKTLIGGLIGGVLLGIFLNR